MLSTNKKADIQLKVRLILYHRGRILLLRQKKGKGGNYTLVGGTIEDSEFAKEALIRESEEEAGLILDAGDLQLAHVLHKRPKNKKQRITLYFKASMWAGKLKTGEPNKFRGVAWFDLEKLPNNLTQTVRHVLEQYRSGHFYSEFN